MLWKIKKNRSSTRPRRALTEEQKKKIEELIEEEEGVTRKVKGFWNITITVLAVAMSAFAIYSTVVPVTTQILRGVHVAFLLALSFLFYPMAKRFKGKINIVDIILALIKHRLYLIYASWILKSLSIGPLRLNSGTRFSA